MGYEKLRLSISNARESTRAIALIWVIVIIAAIFFFFIATKWSYFKLDAVVIWLLSCFSVLFLSQKEREDKPPGDSWWMIALGIGLIVMSFVNIPSGFGNPPYSIGDFSLLLSGASLIFFGMRGNRNYFLPVVLPAVAVIGFQLYLKFRDYLHWVSTPLISPLVSSTTFLLRLLHAEFSVNESVISFLSTTGESITIVISEDCTGIWSIGTFTITCIIILVSFPQARTSRSYLLMLIGYAGTVFSNILRIWFIVFVGYLWGSYVVVKSAHDFFGWLIFSFWVIIFWYLFITRHLNISIFGKIRGGKKV